jgi:predicted ester cyclase
MTIERRYNGGVPNDGDHFVDEDGIFDIVRFILQTTHEIWDEQNFDAIHDYFAEDFISYGAEGREFGDLDDLYSYALTRTAAFPDTRVFVDDLLWTGDEERGFKTSHSFTVTATNTGESRYGPPTSKRLRLTGIANCKVEKRDGQWQYTEERAEDDQFAILRACTPGETGPYPEIPDELLAGADDAATSDASATDAGDSSTDDPTDSTGTHDVPERSVEVSDGGFDPAAFLLDLADTVWNERSVGALDEYYAEDVVVEAASGRSLRDVTALRDDVLQRQAAFPDLELTVEDLMVVEEDGGYNSSMAYRISATHDGPSKYGTASGTPVTFTGIVNRKLRNVGGEWRVVWVREDFDELRLMRQLQ